MQRNEALACDYQKATVKDGQAMEKYLKTQLGNLHCAETLLSKPSKITSHGAGHGSESDGEKKLSRPFRP